MFNGFTAQDVDLPTGRIHYCMGGAGDAVTIARISANACDVGLYCANIGAGVSRDLS